MREVFPIARLAHAVTDAVAEPEHRRTVNRTAAPGAGDGNGQPEPDV